MRIVRLGYLLFVMVLACAHLFVTLSPWTAPAFAAAGSGGIAASWFVAMFAAWIVAVMIDLVLSVLGILPLSFAGEAVFCNVSLAVLSALDGGIMYILCALAPAVIVLVKALEEITGHGQRLKTV
ncbi:MAG TPA: hypothetical protein VNL17_04590 [Verrucomicrobiae bacterium]|nr:hypothetical protein [Verrucomicrobiae bacterium]